MVSRRKVEQKCSEAADDFLRTHPKWQQWLWEYDAYDEVDRSVGADSFPDYGERSLTLLPETVENRSPMT